MVGAGIFSLLGAAGEVAGAAVWISFLLAGAIAGAAGLLVRQVRRALSRRPAGCSSTSPGASATATSPAIVAWLTPRRQRHRHRHGRRLVRQLRQQRRRRRQHGLGEGVRRPDRGRHDARSTSSGRRPSRGSQTRDRRRRDRHPRGVRRRRRWRTSTRTCSPSPGTRSVQDIVSSVALTFFAFLGFGVITFTAKDLAASAPRSCHERCTWRWASPRSSTSPSSLGVFGTLTVDKVIASGGTALAVAAEPALGRAGYWLMTRDRAVRDRRRDQRRALPGRGAVRADGGDRPVPAGDGPAARRPRPVGLLADRRDRDRVWPSASTSARSRRSAAPSP